jgi:hypothetical protein
LQPLAVQTMWQWSSQPCYQQLQAVTVVNSTSCVARTGAMRPGALGNAVHCSL